MKTFKTSISSLLTVICYSLLSLLGFNSCSSEQGGEVMYGMPTGDFEVKGAVTDESGNSVSDAEIRVTHPDFPSGVYRVGETSTDSKGNYEITGHDYLPQMKVVCIPENPNLQPDSVIVKMDYRDADKHDFWDHGHAEETVNFTLKSKEE